MQHGTVGKAGGEFAPLKRVMAVLRKPIVLGSDQTNLSPGEAVDRTLSELPGSCNVVSDVVLPGGKRIDRVVMTMGGIFTIVARGDKGVVTFDGTRLRLDARPLEPDFLAQAQAEATALKDHLAVVTAGDAHFVEPTIVFTRASVKVQGKARGVRVIPRKRLTVELLSGGSRIPAEKRERVAAALLNAKGTSRLRRG